MHVPELGLRLQQIDDNVSSTFDWVFHDPRVGLKDWLLDGSGIFWISGKPGSGKSTLMKFIWYHQWTQEQRWGSPRQKLLASYFFHHRGTYLEKSFEGLLRSVIVQVASTNENLGSLLADALRRESPAAAVKWRVARSSRDADALPQALWTRTLLEKLLLALLRQDIQDLDICLLLDALDEYDGNTDFIVDFLGRLTRESSARTDIRVLFSSRPWPQFVDAFKDCPGFRIHDYTGEDILHFCAASIPDIPDAGTLSSLVDDICRRAKGVFLWVKLVVRDLTRLLAESIQGGQSGYALRESLRHALDAIPDELGDFYETVIGRIPAAFRWEAFVLFQILLRTGSTRRPEDVACIIEVAGTTSVTEGRAVISKRRQSLFASRGPDLDIRRAGGRDRVSRHIGTISGGLIETFELLADAPGEFSMPTIRFMHETVREFVEQPNFKHLVLGVRGKITMENGHSFLAKYAVCFGAGADVGDLRSCLDPIHDPEGRSMHLKESEITTGLSQYAYLADAPAFRKHGISLAAGLGLSLYVNDAVKRRPGLLSEGSHDLATALAYGQSCGVLSGTEAKQMAKLVVAHGWQPHQDPDGLELLARSGRRPTEGWRELDFLVRTLNLSFLDILCFFLEVYRDPGGIGRSKLPRAQATPSGSDSGPPYPTFESMLQPPLHWTTISGHVVQRILSMGADPNMADATGRTPLDSLVADCLSKPRATRGDDEEERGRSFLAGLLGATSGVALVGNGARLRLTTIREWRLWVEWLKASAESARSGPLTEPEFQELFSLIRKQDYPKWLPGYPPAKFLGRFKGVFKGRGRDHS